MFQRKIFTRWIVLALLIAVLANPGGPSKPVLAAGTCGTGTWSAGNLEIHHINIGQGDSTLIVGPTGRSLLFDAGETNWNSSAKAQIIGSYVQTVLGCKSMDYVIISHFHLDHVGYVGYGGLWNLVEAQGFTVGTTLLRNYQANLGDVSGTFTNWKTYLAGPGQAKLHPVTALEGTSQVDLGPGVVFKIVAVDGNGALLGGDFHGDDSPPSENDYSIGALLSYGKFDEWMGGDLDGHYEVSGLGYSYHDIELSVAPEVGDVDVYKVNHHGSSHSSSATFINQLDPEVSIVTVGNGNLYGHPTQEVMNRLLATSTVYLTERGNTNTNIGSAVVAGNIVIKTADGSAYTVNGTPYTATKPIRVDADKDGYFAEADPNDGSSAAVPAPNGGCDGTYQTCSTSCQALPGQVLINEVFPAPSTGAEWVELYNSTNSSINIGNCYIDDIVGGSPAYHIPASTLIPPHGFWTVDQITYFNNGGDEVRFLKEDASTVLETFAYGSTGYNVSWYRLPDGGAWSGSVTASTTKGQSNTIPFYPIVQSVTRGDADPTDLSSIRFTVTFTSPVTGVNISPPFDDFTLHVTDLTGTSISSVSGLGSVYTVTVNTGTGNGSIVLNVIDDDSIRDGFNHPLGGEGPGNGSYEATHQAYTVLRSTFYDVPPEYWASSYIERLYRAGVTGGCTLSPLKYCPMKPVNRAQMAVFLLKAEHGSSYVPPPATGMFLDVPAGDWTASWIEQLADEGITGGCTVTPKQYCPTATITRAQMAVFLLRAEHGSNYTPPPAVGMFADVPARDWIAPWVEQLANEKITGGCGGDSYCPGKSVTRDQMAVFLVRAFKLPDL